MQGRTNKYTVPHDFSALLRSFKSTTAIFPSCCNHSHAGNQGLTRNSTSTRLSIPCACDTAGPMRDAHTCFVGGYSDQCEYIRRYNQYGLQEIEFNQRPNTSSRYITPTVLCPHRQRSHVPPVATSTIHSNCQIPALSTFHSGRAHSAMDPAESSRYSPFRTSRRRRERLQANLSLFRFPARRPCQVPSE